MYHKVAVEDIAGTFDDYQRWVAEGKKKYSGDYVPPGQPDQYFYDTYHSSITDWDNVDGTYEFNFQTFDSPEGDIWVTGKFRVYGEEITILEQKAYDN